MKHIARNIISTFLIATIVCLQSGAAFFNLEKPLTREQQDFLKELADLDDALLKQETKTLFNKYSKVLNEATKEVTKANKAQQEHGNVIVFKIPEGVLFTPDGINLTAILNALNRNNRDPSDYETTNIPETTTTTTTPKPIVIEVKTEASTVAEIPTTVLPEKVALGPYAAASTSRSTVSNSTEISLDLSNTSTEPGSRNGSGSTTPYNHIFRQVEKIINSSAQGNISGILDASLGIATNSEIHSLVNSIFGAVYCNAIRRLLGQC